MAELAAGRFYDAYGASMDAALEAKVRDIESWLMPGLVVDRGCGTGAFMKYLAARGRKVVGIDLADALSEREPGVIRADVMDPVFADGFVDNIVLSSVMHEVYSYKGYSTAAVAVCLSNCARELKRGGRIIVRDIWSPEAGPAERSIDMDADVWDLFSDFLRRTPVSVEVLNVDVGSRRASMSTRTAVEFLSKKDYRAHWDLELREVYTMLPLSLYRQIAATLGLDVVEAKPIRNEWVWQHRLSTGVRGAIPRETNQLVVLEKR